MSPLETREGVEGRGGERGGAGGAGTGEIAPDRDPGPDPDRDQAFAAWSRCSSLKLRLAVNWLAKFTSKSTSLNWRPSVGWMGRLLGRKPPALAAASYFWSWAKSRVMGVEKTNQLTVCDRGGVVSEPS